MADNKKYLDLTGLGHFWDKVKAILDTKVTAVNGMGLSTNDYTNDDKSKLAGISAGAEVNQNAFSSIKVGTTTINSGAKTDTLELAAGDGVSLTPDATGKKVTIKMDGAGAMTGGSVTNSNISGGTITGSTLSGTLTNNGTISGGTISGSTLSGTMTAASGSTMDLDGASSVLVPTATKGDDSTKAASTAFVNDAIEEAVNSAVNTINTTTSGLDTRLGTAEGNITTLQGAVSKLNGPVTEDGSVKKTVKDAVDAAVEDINGTTSGLDTRLGTAEGNITTLQGAVNKLNGPVTEDGSVKKQVADAIAGVVASAPEDFDTLKEIADWIGTDTTGAAQMQTDIAELKAAKGTATLEGHYSPAENTSAALNASGATATDIASSTVQVVTGLKRDAKGHVVGVVSGAVKATNTTYSGSNGITLTGTNFTNSGVRSVATGTANGTISVNTNGIAANVSVFGLKSAAYTDSSDYAPATHDHTGSISGKAATAGTADKVANKFTLKIGSGATEGTSMYSFDGSGAKTLDIVAGSNITLTPAAGKLTIASSFTNTTYTFAGGTNSFTVTPLGGTAQTVNITPSIDKNVIYSGNLTSGQVPIFDGTSGTIKNSGFTLGCSVPANAVFTDTKYTHPTFTAKSAGLYKITVNGEGHVSAATAVSKDDITALGIPAQDTTYVAATTTADGLMSKDDKTNLNNLITICANVPTSAITTGEIDNIIAGLV